MLSVFLPATVMRMWSLTEQQIRDLAMNNGYIIIDSPIWIEQSRMFIQALLKAIEEEKQNGSN